MACMLVMDIGGTFIKSALADQATGILVENSMLETASNSDKCREDFFTSMQVVITHARSFGYTITGVSVSIPGPFDYERGIALMKHKFQAIYQESLTPFFAKEGLPVVYLHDSTAFLLGEMRYGAAKKYKAPAAIMLGTGFGFSMASEGRVCIGEDQRPSVPMWNKPFGEGVVEDSVSRQAIRDLYRTCSGCQDNVDVKEIGTRADAGNLQAQQLFFEVGKSIGSIITSYIPDDRFDCLVLGGQISRSHSFIIPGIQKMISKPIFPARHISSAALRGAAAYLLQGKATSVVVVPEHEVLKN